MDRIPALLGLKLDDEQLALFRQMVRFAISGGLLTIGVAGAYWAVADLLGVEPMVSMTIVYLCFTGVGYLIHSRWSFKDHGSRDQAHIRTVRFFTVNTLGFFSNQFFVWWLVRVLGGPTWWPVIPIIVVTPLLTFTLNRIWVFK